MAEQAIVRTHHRFCLPWMIPIIWYVIVAAKAWQALLWALS